MTAVLALARELVAGAGFTVGVAVGKFQASYAAGRAFARSDHDRP